MTLLKELKDIETERVVIVQDNNVNRAKRLYLTTTGLWTGNHNNAHIFNKNAAAKVLEKIKHKHPKATITSAY